MRIRHGAMARLRRSLSAASICIAFVALAAYATAARAVTGAPPVPAGLDPGGVAIAIIGEGVDYAAPELAKRLARDGEGQLIGRDIAANDARPYRARSTAASPGEIDANDVVMRLDTGPLGHRIIPIRAETGDLVQLARAVGFATQTPARIVILPITTLAGPRGELVRQAASRFRRVLFLVGVPELEGVAETAAIERSIVADNLLFVSVAVDDRPEPSLSELLVEVGSAVQGTNARVAAAIAGAASSAACLMASGQASTSGEVKRLLLSKSDPLRATRGRRVLVSTCAK